MTGAEFLTDYFMTLGVTDIFGIPGGVILDFLYEADKHRERLTPHLSYNEQSAGFAASGYAQVGGKIGVAYATKGPGITNMLTPVADAFANSTPMAVITAHSEKTLNENSRLSGEQELDTVGIFKSVTKYAVRIDRAKDFAFEVEKACDLALSGRRGPVLIDVLSGLLSEEISSVSFTRSKRDSHPVTSVDYIRDRLRRSCRPVLLIGDGVHMAQAETAIYELAQKAHIPVLSSRYSEDVLPSSDLYYGYVGSHGIRYANFILSKADLIISLGNSLSFPEDSVSFKPVLDNAKIIEADIEPCRTHCDIPGRKVFIEDIRDTVGALLRTELSYMKSSQWIAVCDKLKECLFDTDISQPVNIIADIFKSLNAGVTAVCDVGNNEFWASRAYLYSGAANRILYSKSFGALGSSLGRSIGAYYATRRPVLCIVGDQGLQLNSEELQFIGSHNLPIAIALINNHSSGMIKSREKKRFGRYVHTTAGSGYTTANFTKLSDAYGISCFVYSPDIFKCITRPMLVEIEVDEEVDLEPYLPMANLCQKLVPEIDEELYEMLNAL